VSELRLGDLAKDAAAALRGALEAELAGGGIAESLRAFLRVHLGPVFGVKRGIVVGERDGADATFECLLVEPRGAPPLPAAPDAEIVPADAVYGAVEIAEHLDADALHQAADRIAALKRIHRRPLFRGDDLVNPYLGVVLARGGLTGEELLDAVALENDGRPFDQQIDLVCVLDRGLLGHAEVGSDGAVSLELPLQASPRWRLAWIDLGEQALLGAYLAVWETLAARSLRLPRLHVILRALRSRGARALSAAHGLDRGE
jgi:hypothetical protein